MAIQTLHPSFTSATPPISLRRTSASRLFCLHPLRRAPPDRKVRASPSSSLIPSFTQRSEIVDQTRRPPLPMIHGRQLRSQNLSDQEVASLLKSVIRNRRSEAAEQILHELKSRGFNPGCDILSDLMLCYAKSGSFRQAQALWSEIIHSSFVPSIEVIWALMKAYAGMDQFDEITRIVNEISLRNFESSPHVYSMAISCFGKAGQLQLMEDAIKEMVSRGFKVDSFTGNSFVKYYSIYGSLEEMEAAYARLKKSRILIEKEAIRAIASAYINQNEFYKFGEFLRDVGLGRRNLGNLLWNLLLLSYAANFKMKSLQREFLSMLDAGFSPDITTFNIRTLAFSRMSMFWDLHLSIEHMHRKGVAPDLVTYGCIVDAYMNRRLAKNISFALGKFDIESTPSIFTDPLVFEVFGKGDFHTSCEALLQSTRQREWPYSKLLAIHLKKQYRRNQIFWNY